MVMYFSQDGRQQFHRMSEIGKDDGLSEIAGTGKSLPKVDKSIRVSRDGKPKHMSNDGQCPICHRLHDIHSACPRRIANAIMMHPHAVEELTIEDLEWLSCVNGGINVLEILEEKIADMMDEDGIIYQATENKSS